MTDKQAERLIIGMFLAFLILTIIALFVGIVSCILWMIRTWGL